MSLTGWRERGPLGLNPLHPKDLKERGKGGKEMIILMLSANPYLTPQEKGILQLWDKALETRRKLTKPFSIPRAEKDFFTHSEQGGGGSCPRCGPCNGGGASDICKISYWHMKCYSGVGCFVVCVYRDEDPSCGSVETPSPNSLTKSFLQKANEPLTISSTIGGLKVKVLSKDKPVSVEVWDVSGRRIGRYQVKGEKTIKLKPGIYFVRALGKVRKVIVK